MVKPSDHCWPSGLRPVHYYWQLVLIHCASWTVECFRNVYCIMALHFKLRQFHCLWRNIISIWQVVDKYLRFFAEIFITNSEFTESISAIDNLKYLNWIKRKKNQYFLATFIFWQKPLSKLRYWRVRLLNLQPQNPSN